MVLGGPEPAAYAAELQRRHLHVPFECISRADRLNERLVTTLAQMGCRRLWIGAESGSQRILDAMQWGVSAEAGQAMPRQCQLFVWHVYRRIRSAFSR